MLLGLKGRDASTPDRLRAVAELQLQLAHDWASHVQGRLELPLQAPGSTVVGARLGVSYQTIVGLELWLPSLLGGGAALSERSVVFFLQLPWPRRPQSLPPA